MKDPYYRTAVLVILLVFSVAMNIYQYVGRSNTSDELNRQTLNYAQEVSGRLHSMEELLDAAKEDNWSNANDLQGITSQIEMIVRLVSFTVSFSGLDQHLGGKLFISQISELQIDLWFAEKAFNEAAKARLDGTPVDTKPLEDFRARIKEANFPIGDEFTWENLGQAVDRFKKAQE